MLIICPTCGTTYNIEASTLGPGGRPVRCVRCHAVWRVGGSQPARQAAAAAEAVSDAAAVGTGGEPSPAGQASDDAAQDAVAMALSAQIDDAGNREPSPQALTTAAAPPLAPVEVDAAQSWFEPPENARAGADESSAAGGARQPGARRRWPLGAVQTAILALLIIDGALIGWRRDIVRMAPQTASFYAAIGLPVNLRGLTFESVKTTTESHDGVRVLVVEGAIVSTASKTAAVPRLKFALRNAGGLEIFSWTAVPTHSVLPPGEALAFRTRLASPPADARDVQVRFFSRRDAMDGRS